MYVFRERQDELLRAEAQLASSKKRAATLESLLQDKDGQIETLQEMNQGLQLDRDKVCYDCEYLIFV